MRSLKPIRPPVSIEREYHKKLKALLQEMDKSLYWWIRAEYRKAEPEIVGDSAMSDLRDKLKKLVREWMKKFSDKAKEIASWFAGKVQGYTTNNLQQQMKKAKLAPLGFDLKFSYHSQKERAVFSSIVEQNVNLIKSIASEHLKNVQGVVLRGIETGHDLSRMTDDLEKTYGVSERRAAMIARDQTAKASNNLSRQRLLDYGVTKGKWMHTSSGKTYRDSHVEMDGEIYDIEQGCYDPDYGDYIQPGELVNCHCVCIPVIDFSGEKVEDRAMDYNENHDPDNGQFTSEGGGGGGSTSTEVKQEYFAKAKPGEGKVSHDAGINPQSSQSRMEYKVATLIHKTFGGDIRLLQAAGKAKGEKTADFEWNGAKWELKSPSSEKSADSAIRKALKQIGKSQGGIILNYENADISLNNLWDVVDKRMKRGQYESVDVMVIHNDSVKSVKRYKK